MYSQNVTEAAGRRHYTMLGAAIVGAQAGELIGESAVAMAGRVRAGCVGDTPTPLPDALGVGPLDRRPGGAWLQITSQTRRGKTYEQTGS